MLELRTLETAALVELLSDQTQKYSSMMSDGCSEEDFAKCGLMIKAIHSEIEVRRSTTNTSTTDASIVIPE